MFKQCYANVSDLALCQRCPVLFGYKVHRHENDAWLQGIKGKGFNYGSMFHKNISQTFFEAASDYSNRLHAPLARAIRGGLSALEEFVRENIFMPFVSRCSSRYTSGQITAAAEGVVVWVKAMHEFFSEIPSLLRYPEGNMSTVFLLPEQKLRAGYDFPHGYGRLVVNGRYDALMFNPDKAEARLFEFKGYSKTDAVVPLSQSVMYAWLIERVSGIVPSVEIIYLDEVDREPDIFSPSSVKGMIESGLPGLFYTAFNTITLRRLPKVMRNKDCCNKCRFRNDCEEDWASGFRKRVGASMVNVLVFLVASLMITAQVFFFSTMSAETNAMQVKAMHSRLVVDRALDVAIDEIKSITHNTPSPIVGLANSSSTDIRINRRTRSKTEKTLVFDNSANQYYETTSYDVYKKGDYTSFHDETATLRKTYKFTDSVDVYVYDLDYTYIANYDNTISNWNDVPKHNRVFPPMHESNGYRYFLIRVCRLPSDTSQKKLMHQVLVRRKAEAGSYKVEPLSFQEVWYD